MRDLIRKNKNCLRFHQQAVIEIETLREILNLARLADVTGDVKPLRYIFSCDGHRNGLVFPHLIWEDHFNGRPGPVEGERPSAYIIVTEDSSVSRPIDCDQEMAAQSIMLVAEEKGLGGCIIDSIDRKGLRNAFQIPDNFEILSVLALGQPHEQDDTQLANNRVSPDSVDYWHTDEEDGHVPQPVKDLTNSLARNLKRDIQPRSASLTFKPISTDDLRLLEIAGKILEKSYDSFKHTVATAILCSYGRVYTGINIVTTGGVLTCAEPIALGAAIANGEGQFLKMVSVSRSGREYTINNPCGECRQIIVDYAPNINVIVNYKGKIVKTQAQNLLPGFYRNY